MTTEVSELTAASLPHGEFEYLGANENARPNRLRAKLGPVVTVAIRSLLTAGSPRIAGENPEHVRVLAETQAELPPIVVHRATMRVIDGTHRLRAAELRDEDEIAVRFFDGDEADAFVFSVRANVAHGLPLSLADRKAAAARIIASHPHWSDRLIASVTGLSAKTVAAARRRPAEPTLRSVTSPTEHSRIGQDGRARPVNSLERRRLASDLMLDNPSLSLRQVARAAGISPETARSVRAGLYRGEDTVPPKRRGPNRAATPPSCARPDQRADIGPARMPVADRSSVVHHLRTDPTLRFTEIGRTLLRLLDVGAVSDEKWATIVNNVPPHCRDTIAMAAMECARAWQTFAERLEQTTMERGISA
jgi:ParB-like chromosome segregation protein Spo0J